MSTGIIILAAGESARMGSPKQLLPHREVTLLQHAIDTALSVPESPVLVVLGAHAEKIAASTDLTRVSVVENRHWPSGMASSIRIGLGGMIAAHPEISAVLFALCDQPLVTSSVLVELMTTHERTGRSIVACEYAGALGVPALFARPFFPRLLALHGAGGAKQFLALHRSEAEGVPFLDARIDVDTPSDFDALRELSASLPL